MRIIKHDSSIRAIVAYTAIIALVLSTGISAQDACSALTSGASVSSSKSIPANASTGTPAFCEVQATISPVDGSHIGAVYRLPANWNGKLLGIGGGGAAGNVTLQGATPGLARGYAVMQNDLGHASTGATDWAFAVKVPGQPNTEAIIDFG